MDYINHNTSLRTNKHLSYEERFYIEKQLQANVSKSAIAKALGRSRTTIYTEIRRGTTVQIEQGKPILVYLADCGQGKYGVSRKGSFNTLKSFLLIPMPHGSVALMRGTTDYYVASFLKVHLFTRCLKQLLNEQQTGVIHCLEKSSVTVHRKRHSLTKSKS